MVLLFFYLLYPQPLLAQAQGGVTVIYVHTGVEVNSNFPFSSSDEEGLGVE